MIKERNEPHKKTCELKSCVDEKKLFYKGEKKILIELMDSINRDVLNEVRN